MKPWLFKEAQHEGVSYSNETMAAEYDSNHLEFRDYGEEARDLADLIGLQEGDRVIDFGAGTGALTIELAKLTQEVHAVDIAQEMLDQLTKKANDLRLTNITTENAGFLTASIPEEKYDAAISNFALHHLPDFWKQIAIRRIAESIKIGGRFFLGDVVFDFPFEEYEEQLDRFHASFAQVSKTMGDETIVHIRDEMSTYSWIMEKMLTDAGFRIDSKLSDGNALVKYCCTRER